MNKYLTLDIDALVDDVYISEHFLSEYDEGERLSIFFITGLNKTFVVLAFNYQDTPDRIAVDKDGTAWVSNARSIHDTIGVSPDLEMDCWYHGDELMKVTDHFEIPKNTPWYHMVGLCETQRLAVSGELATKIEEKVKKLLLNS